MKDQIYNWLVQYGSTLATTAMVIVTIWMLTGCGTVAGLGKDIQTSAEWTKEKMSGDKNTSNKGGSQ